MSVQFTINGKEYAVNALEIPIETSLNTFIRNHAHLSGTKFMCLEGGCGACIVTVKGRHPVSNAIETWAVNSCLQPVLSCHGLDIITVEGVGNQKQGYDQTQTRIVQLNGIQCGYCTPGMVMNMFSLLESKKGKITMAEVENSFGGNICRCTGYRPILDAFKSLAIDADEKLLAACKDIEDLSKTCPKTGAKCAGGCNKSSVVSKKGVHLQFEENKEWHKVYNISDIFPIFAKLQNEKYMLVAGNTAHGVYRRDPDIKVFIDITGVEELRAHSIDAEITLGANISLTETMEIFEKAAVRPGFEYLKELQKHIDLIANVPVRNAGTLAGNLAIKFYQNEFPSDLFLMFESVGAKLEILEDVGRSSKVSLTEFLKINLKNKIIYKVILPALPVNQFLFRSYKIMPRAQNAHAYVNAGFLIEFKESIVQSARVCYGGINPGFVHAENTENYLIGKDLYTTATLQAALSELSNELDPDFIPPDASRAFRKNLALALFYKYVLNTCPSNKLKSALKSGGHLLTRPLSSGQQNYESKKERYPLNKAIPRVDGIVQSSGETKYSNDIPSLPGELWAAFVPAKKVHGVIVGFDTSEAMKLKGVRAFFSAKDIPGTNSFTSPKFGFCDVPEEIFAQSKVLFYGQPAGVIIAENNQLAWRAAALVNIKYENDVITEPIFTTIESVLKANATDRIIDQPFVMKSTEVGTDEIAKTIKGSASFGAQYHFTMEPQTCVAVPIEDGYEVYCATQWMDFCQAAVAGALDIDNNCVNVEVRRLGGGYGGKISRPNQVACAAAIAAHHLRVPIRLVLSIESNMSVIGKRDPCYGEYTVDVDQSGKIQKLVNNYWQDFGCSINEPVTFNTTEFLKNCYNHSTWDVTPKAIISNTPSNTWCRAPGSTEAVAMIEQIMEHIAHETGTDAIEVRRRNMSEDNPLQTFIPQFLQMVDYVERKRQVELFNLENRWRKRGLAMIPQQYPVGYFGHYPAFVSIYHVDGTVAISHGGIEMGQGINTKVAQVAAKVLGISVEKIKIKPSNNLISANSNVSGGSITSESVAFAVLKACEILNERLKPMREVKPDGSFEDIVRDAYLGSIDLTASYFYKASDLVNYNVYALSAAEIEIDLLTGNILINRVDILEDTGESLSLLMDIGQIEGAFVMGLGYWLHETISYGKEGELLNDRTWTYKPPGAKDIPVDFRIHFIENTANEKFVLRSKATGEPPLCMAVVLLFALRYALNSARKDAGLPLEWYDIRGPATTEDIFTLAGTKSDYFTL